MARTHSSSSTQTTPAAVPPRLVPPVPEPLEARIEPLRCRAVLTHHWLVRRRGGERVLEALAELLPEAPIYTLVADTAVLRDEGFTALHTADASGSPRPIRTSWLDRLPGARRHYPRLLPLLPLAARSVRLPPAELVVCSDAGAARIALATAASRVVCYCHSPMRYVWDLRETYAAGSSAA